MADFNNPGNLRPLPNGQAWAGQIGVDNGFDVFADPAAGDRAATINLINQQRLHGLNTLSQIISKYAPPGDGNDTSGYITRVSRETGLSPNEPLNLSDPATLRKVKSAIYGVESGGSPASGGGMQTDTSGGGDLMSTLAPLLRTIIAGGQPDATQLQLFKQMQDRSQKSIGDFDASNQNLKAIGQKMAGEHSPDPINGGDFQPPDKAKIEKDELAKVSDQPMNPTRVMGQFLPMLAILGGAFVKHGAIASLQAAGAAMNAAKANDQAAIDKAHNEFTDAMTELKTRMDTAKSVYEENRNKYGDDMAGFAAQQSIQEAQDKNDLAAQALASGNYEHYFNLKNSTFTAYEKVLPIILAAQNHKDAMDSKVQILQDGPGGPNYVYNPSEHKATTLDGQPYTPTSASHIQGGRPISMAADVMQAFDKQNPNATAQQKMDFVMHYMSQTAAGKAFATGKQGDTIRSLNVSVAHLQTLRELGAALENGDVTAINAAKQRFSEEFGVPAPTNFDAAKSIVADEVAKGVIGGQSAQSDRETLAASLRKSGSPAVIDGAVETFQRLLGGQLTGLREQYQNTTGQTNFDDMLLPETKAALGVTDDSSDKGSSDKSPQNGSYTLSSGALAAYKGASPEQKAAAKAKWQAQGFDVSGLD